MKRSRGESETFHRGQSPHTSGSANHSTSTNASSSSMSPRLLWCCYFSLLAQLAARANGYVPYSPPSTASSTAWTQTSRADHKQLPPLPILVLQRPLPLPAQKRGMGLTVPGTLHAVPIGSSMDLDRNNYSDADPYQPTTTAVTDHDHALPTSKQRATTTSGSRHAVTSIGRSPYPAQVSSPGITWSSPVSGLGTSTGTRTPWFHSHSPVVKQTLRSDASSSSSLSSRSYIDSLKVADLKQACAERGLPKSGNKETLRDRLWKWETEKNQREKVNITGDFLTRYFEAPTREENGLGDTTDRMIQRDNQPLSSVPNSLAEWARTVDLNPLLQKRKEIHRQMREGRPAPPKPSPPPSPATDTSSLASSGYLKSLARALRAPSSPYASNIKVKELYAAAKQADQLGERMLAMDLLQTLLVVTPTDARVSRRLARMYTEQGDLEKAKETLKSALQKQEENPWLWHGLGQLERKHGVSQLAKDYFAKAIHYDPTFAPAYHALGTMEHSQGNVASAMRIIKKGIEFCPSNHRLWHACGCFYRAAQMLEDADRCYRRALNLGPPTSHCFVYSALASVAYEQGDVDRARRWLVKAVQDNHGRYAQGWVALSQLEEAENNIQKAQLICTSAVAQYERGLLEMRSRLLDKNMQDRINATTSSSTSSSSSSSSLELTNQLLHNVPQYRSGDKFVYVYRNWARLEETHGSPEAVDRVYERACTAFPLDYKLLITWAQYHQKTMNHHKARELFRRARITAGHRHADPYRISAEMEMSLSNYHGARGILRFGAQALLSHHHDTSQSTTDNTISSSDTDDGRGLSLLFHTWAICEWHLGNLDRAEALFAQALQLTSSSVKTPHLAAEMKSFILYSIARFKHDRGELHLAQHCIGLIMKENVFPGGLARVWTLWADIARDMNNPKLEEECLAKASIARNSPGTQDSLDSLFQSGHAPGVVDYRKSGTESTILSQDPWYIKLFGVKRSDDASGLFKQLKYPTKISGKGKRIGKSTGRDEE